MAFVFVRGPTLLLLNGWIENLGNYIRHFFSLGFWNETCTEGGNWQNGWTIFYWAWWIAWCLFVGMFISTGLPFAVVMFFICFAVIKGLVEHAREHALSRQTDPIMAGTKIRAFAGCPVWGPF